jgi:tetratricopeptide (TPR) repeat protein
VEDSQLLSPALSLDHLRRQFPGHRVLRQVGHGAMGVVYEAVQAGLGRRVALKVLPPTLALRERTVRRFLREAEAMGKLAHPSIVDVYEVGSIEDLHYFSMKFVEGPPLDRVVKAGPLAVADVIEIGISVAGALAHAHSRGVLHRDVKPSNLLRDEERVVLTDFGLARPVDSADGGSMTESGDLVGTPLYMSPEQISGDAERIDGRADVWGLGVTLYELLTQRTPFTGPNAQGILHAILHKDPPLLHRLRDDVPRDLEAVILKCLEKDPERRYSTAAALRDDLEAVRDGQAVSASRPRLYDPALRWVRRHRGEATAIGAIGVLALAALFSWQGAASLLEDVSAERDTAEQLRSQAVESQREEFRQRTMHWALLELYALRQEALDARSDSDREEALQRMFELIERASDIDPTFFEPGAEALCSMLHQRGDRDEQAVAVIDEWVADRPLREQLRVKAAALTGLERHTQALDLHRQRARLDPRDPDPRIDAARALRRLSALARGEGQDERARRELGRGLAMLVPALEVAVAARDEKAVVEVLIERGRCFLDLGQLHAARADLERALAKDTTSIEADMLLRACKRRLDERGQPELLAAAPPPGAPVESEDEEGELDEPALSIEALLPKREDLADELETAGRGFRSIYGAVKGLLDEPAEDEAAEQAPAPQPAPPEFPPPGAGRPDGAWR